MLGVAPDQILINDLKVNPLSHQTYIAVSRGRGPDAIPVILKMDGSGKMVEFSLKSVKSAAVSLADAPNRSRTLLLEEIPKDSLMGIRGRNPLRTWHTSMEKLSLPVYPMRSSLPTYATSRFRLRTQKRYRRSDLAFCPWQISKRRAPIRKFIPYTIDKQPYILASYTCTPLVKIPVSSLKPGSKVTGTTIAELGESNQPLEMFHIVKTVTNTF